MKCPKCGYISFDFNQLCPKCSRNISAEQERLNLPSFRPDPPALLGFLIGEANESNVNLRVPASHLSRMASGEASLGDSIVLDQDTMDVEDQDLDLSFETEEQEEDIFGKDEVEPEKGLSDSDFRLEENEGEEASVPSGPGEEEDISLDLGDLSLEESEAALGKLEDAGAAADLESDLDGIESEIELDLDDLKVSDIGNLEIGADMGPPLVEEMESTLVESEEGTLEPELEFGDQEEEKLPDISELVLDQGQGGNQEKTMIMDDFSLDAEGAAEKEGALELGEVKLDDLELGEEELLDLEGLDVEGVDSGSKDQPMLFDDLDINDSGELEKSFDISDISVDEDFTETKEAPIPKKSAADSGDLEIDLDAMSLDVDEYQKKGDSDEEYVMDLDDMDIDLDFDEPKK